VRNHALAVAKLNLTAAERACVPVSVGLTDTTNAAGAAGAVPGKVGSACVGRGRTSLGATFYRVIADYSRQLDDAGGQMYLSGLTPQLFDQLEDTQILNLSGPIHPVAATDVVGESTREALREAHAWLVEHSQDAELPT